MSKKNLLLPFTTLALLLGVGLAACSGTPQEGSQGSASEESQPVQSSQAQQRIKVTAADGKTSIYLGETVQLTADQEGVTWESAKPEIASVNASGLVTAVAEGTATITAKKDGFTNGTISIRVQLVPITVSSAGDAKSVVIDQTLQLSADKDGVSWKSSDETIATVSDGGLVTGKKAGSVTITASKDGFKAGTIGLTITRTPPIATLHMEDAEHFSADGSWASSNDPENSPVYNKSNASDGTCCAHFGGGDIETIRFSSNKAIKAEIVLMIGYYYSIDDLAAIYDVKFNGVAVTMPAGQSYTPEDTSNYTYQECSFGELDVIADTNVLEIAMKEDASRLPYMDDLRIYSSDSAEITLVPAPQKDPVTVKSESLTVKEGKTVAIESDMTGLSYKSASQSVATVDENGVVTGVKVGTTTIAVSKEGFKTIRVAIEVTEAEGVFVASIEDVKGEGVTTRTSQNLTAPYNYIVDTWEVGAVGTLEVDVKKAGTYNFYMRYRSGSYGSSTVIDLATAFEIKINGTKLDLSGEVSASSFTDQLLGEVTLAAGKVTIEIKCLEKVPTINLFRFIPKA